MSDLRPFQNNNVDQARIVGVSAIPPMSTSYISEVGRMTSNLGGAVFDSYQKGVEKNKEDRKAGVVGSVSEQLAGISQASATTPGYDFEANVRKLHQKAVGANPALADEIGKLIEQQSGINPAGESRVAIEARERTKEAEEAGAINQYMTDEERRAGEKAYYDNKTEMEALNSKLEKIKVQKELGELGDAEAMDAVYGSLTNSVNTNYQSLDNKSTSWRRRFDSGEDPKALLMEVRQEKLRQGQLFAQFGSLATGDTGAALIKPNQDILDLAEQYVTGAIDAKAYDGQTKALKSKANAILHSDPETLAAIVASEAFQFSPTVKLQISTTAAKAKNRLSNTLINMDSQTANDLNYIFGEMCMAPDNPEAVQEGTESVASLVDEFDRNGSMMSKDDMTNTMTVLGSDKVWSTASAETKQQAADAFQLHMADTIMPSLREMTSKYGLNNRNMILVTDGNGLRIKAVDGYMPRRQDQLAMRKANKELASYNSALNMMMNATGLPMEQVVNQYFKVPLQSDTSVGPNQPTSNPLQPAMDLYQQLFVEPSVGVYQGTNPSQAPAVQEPTQSGPSFAQTAMDWWDETFVQPSTGVYQGTNPQTPTPMQEPTQAPQGGPSTEVAAEAPVSVPETSEPFDATTASREEVIAEQQRVGATADGKWGPQSQRAAEFTEMAAPIAQELGADLATLQKMARVESNFKPKAKAGTSSAGGYFQFIDSTWDSMLAKYGDEVGVSMDADKTDPVANTKMAIKLIEENTRMLSRATGREPTTGDLYLAHFAGPATAIKAMRANPSAPASSVFTAGQIKANKSVLEGKTVGEVLEWAESKMQ